VDPPRKKADRPITAAEVKSWFGNTKQQKLKPDIYGKIAACLNRLRWPSDPLPEDGFRPTTSKSGLWDLKAAAKTANTLLNYMPAMLSHWHEPKWSPEHRAAYEAVSALNERRLLQPCRTSSGPSVVQTKHQLAKKCRKIGTCARAGDLTSKIHAVLDTNGLPVHLASRPVKRMTIGCVRFCSTRCSHKQCCSRIVDTTQTGSGSLPDSRELGRTFRRNEIGRTQSALVLYLYRARNLIERFFNKIKQCRRVATRYDKLAANYLAFVKLASIRTWLRANESMP